MRRNTFFMCESILLIVGECHSAHLAYDRKFAEKEMKEGGLNTNCVGFHNF